MEWYNHKIQELGEFAHNHHRWMIVATFLPFAVGAAFLQGGTTLENAAKSQRCIQSQEICIQAAELLPIDAPTPSTELSLQLLNWSIASK